MMSAVCNMHLDECSMVLPLFLQQMCQPYLHIVKMSLKNVLGHVDLEMSRTVMAANCSSHSNF